MPVRERTEIGRYRIAERGDQQVNELCCACQRLDIARALDRRDLGANLIEE